MFILLSVIAFIYIMLLFKKKYPISLSMYWVVVFSLIYIFVPMIRENTTNLRYISKGIVEKIASYSVIGLLSFIMFNIIFLFKFNILEKEIEAYTVINYKTVKNILIIFFVIYVILLMLTIGSHGISNIINSGSRGYWLGGNKKNIFYTFAELSSFYITILGSVFVLAAKNKTEKKNSIFVFIILVTIASVLVFARRHVIYPLFAIIFWKLSKNKNKKKIISIGLILIPIFFFSMFIMGYFRTYGISNTNIENIINYFKYGNFLDIFLSNTDFWASYFYLSKQVMNGNVQADLLGYFKVLFTLIPRTIWEAKPNYVSVEILSIIEPVKASQGFSAGTGYIGEALATMGIGGIIIVSSLWGIICGYLDKKYYYLVEKKNKYLVDNKEKYGFTIYEYLYLYTGMLLITESHRGDFGAASIHFVLEILTLAILFKISSKKTIKL